MGQLDALRTWADRNPDAPSTDWRVAQKNGWRTDATPAVDADAPTDRLTRAHATNTRLADIQAKYPRELFLAARPKADRLVYVLLRQLGELDATAARDGRAWYDAKRETLTVAQGSEWITRIRTKIADAVTASTPADRINAALAMNPHLNAVAETPVDRTDFRSHPDAWTTWRNMAKGLAATGGHPSGSRFAIDNIDQTTNDVSFWWITVSKKGFAKIRQVIGGRGPVDVRMSPEAMTAIGQRIIDAGPQAAMVRFGQLIGSCGDCGRELTNEESRKAGIGPKCRTRH
jgi:hypothetical protein